MNNQDNKKKLDVKLFWNPASKKKKFKGEARFVSSKNKVGEFDILPGHANFITLIADFIKIETTEGTKKSYEFNRGVLEVAEDQVKVFLGL